MKLGDFVWGMVAATHSLTHREEERKKSIKKSVYGSAWGALRKRNPVYQSIKS